MKVKLTEEQVKMVRESEEVNILHDLTDIAPVDEYEMITGIALNVARDALMLIAENATDVWNWWEAEK